MIPLLQKLASKFAAEKQSAETEWNAIVSRVVTGDATEAEVAKVLKLSGRTLDELEADVIREQRIAELRLIAEKLPDAVKKSEDAQLAHTEIIVAETFVETKAQIDRLIVDQNV